MAEIMVGEEIVSKAGKMGKIVSANKDYVQVQFGNRVAKFLRNAFEKGFLAYTNTIYHFSKNISYSLGKFNNSEAYSAWHISDMGREIYLNEVVKRCNCGYLNDYISEEDINCWQYAKLLFLALYSNKAEIIFKNKLFLETYRIENLVDYLKSFPQSKLILPVKTKQLIHCLLLSDLGVGIGIFFAGWKN